MAVNFILSRKKYENDEKSQKNLKIGRKSDVFYGIIDYTDSNM